jgi:hypothetical protein
MAADNTATAVPRRYFLETITNVSIMRARIAQKGPAELLFGFRMAFLVWSRKDGPNSRSDRDAAPISRGILKHYSGAAS